MNILYFQSAIVTILSVIFVLLPSVQAAYQILSALTVTMYLIMYMLMFAAFIKLRIKEPNTPRPFKVPGGELGMWLVGGVGLISAFAAFLVGFIPPGQIPPPFLFASRRTFSAKASGIRHRYGFLGGCQKSLACYNIPCRVFDLIFLDGAIGSAGGC